MLYTPVHMILDVLSLYLVREDNIKKEPRKSLQKIYRIPLEDMRDYMSDDKDNVHMSSVKRENIKVLRKLENSDSSKYCYNDVLKEERLKNQELEKLFRVIEEIDSVYQGIKETEILRLIWERINLDINAKVKSELINTFINQILDVKDYSSNLEESGMGMGIVCISGRIPRYLQTLERLDAENIINYIPMYYVKDIIENKIISINDKFKGKYNRIIKYCNNYFYRTLVKKGIISRKELHNITKDYYQYIKESNIE